MLKHPAVLALALLSAAAPAARAQAPLVWKLSKGEQFTLAVATEYKETITVMGKQLNNRAKIAMAFDVTVRDPLRDGRATLSLKVASLEAEGTQNAEAIAKLAKVVKGATFSARIGPKMKLEEVGGIEALAKEIAEREGEPQAQSVLEQTLKMLFRYLLEEAFLAVPGQGTAKGDTWEQTSELDALGLGTLVTRKTLTDEGPATMDGKEVRKIGLKGVMKFAPPKAGAGGVLPFTVEKLDMKKQDYKGTAYFDPAAGRPLRIETRVFTDLSMTLGINGMKIDADGVREQTFRIRFAARRGPSKE